MKTIEPPCPVFGICGGCAYQDIPYEEELSLKEKRLRQLVERGLRLSRDVIDPIVRSPCEYGYRNRMDLALKRTQEGFMTGFQPAGRKRVIPVESCAIARPEISAAISTICEDAKLRLPGDYRVANLVIRTGDDGRVLWGGIGRGSLSLKEEDYLWAEIEGKRVFYSLGTFFQANLSILPWVIQKIRSLGLLHPETVFLDLYAGVGLFGIMFAREVKAAVLIEESVDSTKLARFNAAYHRYDHLEIREGKVEMELAKALEGHAGSHKIALADPPRRGLSAAALEAIAEQTDLASLLYLSCNPETLAGDLATFVKKGWRVRKLIPFDFFPKTSHLETLAWLEPTSARMSSPNVLVGDQDRTLDSRLNAFGNDKGDIEIEIGCGKGSFLWTCAAAHPDIFYLGLDRVGKWMKRKMQRTENMKIENLCFQRSEIREFLKSIPPARINAFHIYFPDPWPKRRHRKRRLVGAAFLKELYTLLVSEGFVHLATDDRDYFEQMKKAAAENGFWKMREGLNERLVYPEFKTNYERKFLLAGKTIYYLELLKTETSDLRPQTSARPV